MRYVKYCIAALCIANSLLAIILVAYYFLEWNDGGPKTASTITRSTTGPISHNCGKDSETRYLPANIVLPPDVSTHKNKKLLPMDICGSLTDTYKILNGNSTSLFEFPWMALLIYKTTGIPFVVFSIILGTGYYFMCGGTLINDRYVLTAGHCVRNDSEIKLFQVRLGEYDITNSRECEASTGVCSDPYQDMDIEETVVHPEYDSCTFVNDIGLIRLKRPADILVENVKPVCLPVDKNSRDYKFNNTYAIITGWGNTESGHPSDVLLKREIPMISNEECHMAHTGAPITYKQVCSKGQQGIDACRGDGGGPLLVAGAIGYNSKYIQQGIISFGSESCGTEGVPGVYTRVVYYMDWLLNNLRP